MHHNKLTMPATGRMCYRASGNGPSALQHCSESSCTSLGLKHSDGSAVEPAASVPQGQCYDNRGHQWSCSRVLMSPWSPLPENVSKRRRHNNEFKSCHPWTIMVHSRMAWQTRQSSMSHLKYRYLQTSWCARLRPSWGQYQEASPSSK